MKAKTTDRQNRLRRLTVKRQIQLRLRAYSIVRDALESGLGFALNRLQDAAGERDLQLDDELRERAMDAMDAMINELAVALDARINWEKSG
jgi:hypothetical protein